MPTFSEFEQRLIAEAIAAGKVERIENGSWPFRKLLTRFETRTAHKRQLGNEASCRYWERLSRLAW